MGLQGKKEIIKKVHAWVSGVCSLVPICVYIKEGKHFFLRDSLPDVSGCLCQIYPKLDSQLDHLRVVERCLALFKHFVGVRVSNKMGPTSFRLMARYSTINCTACIKPLHYLVLTLTKLTVMKRKGL